MEPITNYIKTHSKGKNQPILGSHIAKALGITGVNVRKRVNDARSCGDPICSSSRGYYIAANKDELNDTIESMLGRIEGISRAVEGLRQCSL